MSGIFEAIDKARQYCVDHMDLHDICTYTYPPVHRFDKATFVEDMVQQIDNIEQSFTYVKDGAPRSEAADQLRKLISNTAIPTATKRKLYEIAGVMDNELALVKSSVKEKTPPFYVCKPLLAFIDSYYQNGGHISRTVVDKIMNYCSQIETDYQRMRNHEQKMYEDYIELKEAVEKILK